MKKLLLGLGSIASVVAPVAAVISCGDDSKTTPGTNGAQGTEGHTVTITDNTALGNIKNGLNASLAIDATKVKDVVAGDNLGLTIGSSSINLAHYTKITFNAATTYDAGIGSQPIKAGDTLVMGMPAASKRVAAPEMHVILMSTDTDGNANNQDLTDTLKSNHKLAALKTGVMDVVVAAVEASKPDAGNGAGSTTGTTTVQFPAQIGNAANKAVVSLLIMGAMPTHLAKANIEPAMTSLKALTGIAAVTEITFTVVATDGTNTTQKQFVVTVTAGKANDVDAIATAAANVAATDIVADGGGTGTGTPTHKTVDFTAHSGHASSTPWHNSFRDNGGTGSTIAVQLVAGDIIEATVSSHKYSYTLTAQDITALTNIADQDAMVNKVAELIASASSNAVTADQVKTAMGISASSGMHHSFTTGTAGSTGTPSTTDVTVDLGASTGADFAAGEITWTTLWTKIKAAIGTNHPTNIMLTVDGKTLTLATLSAWTEGDIKTALTTALTHDSTFAGCFDTSK